MSRKWKNHFKEEMTQPLLWHYKITIVKLELVFQTPDAKDQLCRPYNGKMEIAMLNRTFKSRATRSQPCCHQKYKSTTILDIRITNRVLPLHGSLIQLYYWPKTTLYILASASMTIFTFKCFAFVPVVTFGTRKRTNGHGRISNGRKKNRI